MYHHPVLFVAKHEISKWPVVGSTGKLINTVFVKRDRKTSRQQAAKVISKRVLIEKN